MSAYENVVGGKLKLKGKALNIAGGVKKKKKHKHYHHDDNSQIIRREELQEGGNTELPTDPTKEITNADKVEDEDHHPLLDGDQLDGDQMTPAERRYIEQRERIDMRRLVKTANKSHRDRIEDFNQYLANLSEHYDIPKVGPG